ncbi:dihydrodipicolinate reductase [Litoreibacter roseus]|uniref:Dihydrodipicolinate reductase n=1 Tax=Litoreibacter roseus TaxID=2601869 RepID=A0A6N6JM03_9RHOB|nr:dihydrodipicolinate reductase [Litoreibacter roseus]GFE66308.1 hypothetical protein KIN_33820 [Litoreibacter roseus]
MSSNRLLKIFAICVSVIVAPLGAYAFEKVESKSEFVDAVAGKDLTIFAINVSVMPDGQIKGRAYGRPVSGQWQWRDGYFCRSLYWGSRDLGPNCQEVKLRGNKVRFTSDRGNGRYADLTVR